MVDYTHLHYRATVLRPRIQLTHFHLVLSCTKYLNFCRIEPEHRPIPWDLTKLTPPNNHYLIWSMGSTPHGLEPEQTRTILPMDYNLITRNIVPVWSEITQPCTITCAPLHTLGVKSIPPTESSPCTTLSKAPTTQMMKNFQPRRSWRMKKPSLHLPPKPIQIWEPYALPWQKTRISKGGPTNPNRKLGRSLHLYRVI